jgi:DNA mismatch endonuclease (patch repair protein)
MARIRGRDTSPEKSLRRALRAAGIKFRTYPDLPGRPDIILLHTKTVIFVHGCFWHGCPKHYTPPSTRAAFWAKKLETNRARDRSMAKRLRTLGWRVLTVWECQVARDVMHAVKRIERATRRS